MLTVLKDELSAVVNYRRLKNFTFILKKSAFKGPYIRHSVQPFRPRYKYPFISMSVYKPAYGIVRNMTIRGEGGRWLPY